MNVARRAPRRRDRWRADGVGATLTKVCGHGVVVTRDLPKVETTGSSPVARSTALWLP